MEESHFTGIGGPETVAFSEGQFDFVVQPLDNAPGNLLFGDEIVDQELSVFLEGASHLLEGLQA